MLLACYSVDLAHPSGFEPETSPFGGVRSIFGLLPRCFRDHGSSFPASFEFHQTLGFPRLFRPSPTAHLT